MVVAGKARSAVFVALMARDDLALATMHRCCLVTLPQARRRRNRRTARFERAPAAAAGTRAVPHAGHRAAHSPSAKMHLAQPAKGARRAPRSRPAIRRSASSGLRRQKERQRQCRIAVLAGRLPAASASPPSARQPTIVKCRRNAATGMLSAMRMPCSERRSTHALAMELDIAHPPIGGGIARAKPYGQAKGSSRRVAARPGASATSHLTPRNSPAPGLCAWSRVDTWQKRRQIRLKFWVNRP